MGDALEILRGGGLRAGWGQPRVLPELGGSRTGRGWLWPGLCSPLRRDERCRVPRPGVPMGVLSCMKYLMFIFNVLVFVSPPGPGGVEGSRPRGVTSPASSEGWVTPVQGRGPQQRLEHPQSP